MQAYSKELDNLGEKKAENISNLSEFVKTELKDSLSQLQNHLLEDQ